MESPRLVPPRLPDVLTRALVKNPLMQELPPPQFGTLPVTQSFALMLGINALQNWTLSRHGGR